METSTFGVSCEGSGPFDYEDEDDDEDDLSKIDLLTPDTHNVIRTLRRSFYITVAPTTPFAPTTVDKPQ